MATTTSLIAGSLRPPRGRPQDLVNPATGELVAEVCHASEQDIDTAAAAARAGFATWSALTPGERARILLRAADLVEQRLDEVAALEVADTGKPWTTARDGEIAFAVDNLRFFAGAARSLEGTGAGIFSTGYTSMLLRQPLGVIGAIVPWNFPFVIAVWKAGAALAAGNAVVLKPAALTPRSTVWLANVLHEAGVPVEAVQVILGDRVAGAALVDQSQVDMVTVTGSTETGRSVMATAAQTPKKVHLELGGKAPALVLADADVAEVASAVTMAALYNTGQDCTAATRVYVENTQYHQVVDAIRAQMADVRAGPPTNPQTQIGPLISAEHRDRVSGFVKRAHAAGASVILGGEHPDGDGFYYPPTLIVNAEQDSELVQDEVFGPVLVVLPVADEAAAVHHANDTQYGLASSVWSRDTARALRTSHQLHAGVTWINDHLPIASEMPHGGAKGTGFGVDLSHQAVLEYTTSHHVMIKHADRSPPNGFRPP